MQCEVFDCQEKYRILERAWQHQGKKEKERKKIKNMSEKIDRSQEKRERWGK